MAAARLLSQIARQSSTSGACLLQDAVCQLPKSFTTVTPAAERLLGSCVLERLPVIMPEVPDWEVDHRMWQLELQNKHAKALPDEFIQPKTTYEQGEGEESSQQWQPAPRETEADVAGDTKSLWRCLDKRLFLLVKVKGDGQARWQFPQAENQQGETMRQTAERALQETIQEGPQTYFVGNAPMGHVGDSGSTAFFHKAQLIKGEAALKQDSQAYEYAWASKDEMPKYIADKPQQELLEKMLGS